jgi:splicing factor 3B subunit 3
LHTHLAAPPRLPALRSRADVGDLVTSIVRTQLMPGGADVLFFATVSGRLGALLPLSTREDVDFFQQLEMFMRQERAPLCGRDHLQYRSYFLPVKEVIDGDLCDQFGSLPAARQKVLAEERERTPAEILKKLEDVRGTVL